MWPGQCIIPLMPEPAFSRANSTGAPLPNWPIALVKFTSELDDRLSYPQRNGAPTLQAFFILNEE